MRLPLDSLLLISQLISCTSPLLLAASSALSLTPERIMTFPPSSSAALLLLSGLFLSSKLRGSLISCISCISSNGAVLTSDASSSAFSSVSLLDFDFSFSLEKRVRRPYRNATHRLSMNIRTTLVTPTPIPASVPVDSPWCGVARGMGLSDPLGVMDVETEVDCDLVEDEEKERLGYTIELELELELAAAGAKLAGPRCLQLVFSLAAHAS